MRIAVIAVVSSDLRDLRVVPPRSRNSARDEEPAVTESANSNESGGADLPEARRSRLANGRTVYCVRISREFKSQVTFYWLSLSSRAHRAGEKKFF
eukprot:377587-Hanusia_phi.AAC.1